MNRSVGVFVAAMAAIVLGVGCSGDGDASGVTRPDDPAVTLPEGATDPAPAPTDPVGAEPTVAPEPTAAPEQPAPPEQPVTTEPIDEGDGTTGGEAVAIALLLVLLAAVIGLIVWLARRSDGPRHLDDSSRRQFASISTRTRWVVDQGVPSLLGSSDPVAQQSTWTMVDSTLREVHQELIGIPRSGDAQAARALSDLELAVASMRGALDSGYQMRTQHPEQPDVVGAVDRAILIQREQLLRAITAFEIDTA